MTRKTSRRTARSPFDNITTTKAWGPLVVPGRVGKKFPHGFRHAPPLHVHVSRGVGGIELPIRTFAAPEVAVFELVERRR